MKKLILKISPFLHINARALVPLIALVLFGCESKNFRQNVNLEEHDYRLRYSLAVESVTATTWLLFEDDSATLSLAQTSKLSRYLSSYRSAGHGQISVTVKNTGVLKPLVNKRIRNLITLARNEGIRLGEIVFEQAESISSPDGADSAKLEYKRFVVDLPQCSNWSQESFDTSRNVDHPNLGCATQTNLGTMIVDPADLMRMRVLSLTDAELGDNAIRVLRAPTAPTAPAATGGGTTTGTAN